MTAWPKLSEDLPFARHPNVCQSCGQKGFNRWREHDDQDDPTDTIVILCDVCDRIIKPHKRLYSKLQNSEPVPGAMEICLDCIHCKGLICRSPMRLANGGSGLPIRFPKPMVMCVDFTDGSGHCVRFYPPGTITCDGREVWG